MFNGKTKPAGLARAFKWISSHNRGAAYTTASAVSQGPSRGGYVRAPARDARYVPADDDDDQWFYEHPDRMFRLRLPLPDDPADAPAARCACGYRRLHGYRVLVARRPGDCWCASACQPAGRCHRRAASGSWPRSTRSSCERRANRRRR
jgi:hypothetical protein